MRITALFALLAVLLPSCSMPGQRLHSEPTEHGDVGGLFVRSGAPHPLACVTDEDCVSGPGVNPDNGCCDTGVHNGVYSRAYLQWRGGWARMACVNVDCPMLRLPPAPPSPCVTEGRCLSGRCGNTCDSSSE